jgi:hypothetical protein
MKLLLAALAIWSLPLFGMSCGSATVQEPASAPTPETVTLTAQNPTASFPLQTDFKNLPKSTDIPPSVLTLQVAVTKVVNPGARAVNIFVYLSRPNEKRDNPAQKIELGSFSLYPADSPGKFTLNGGAALRKASAASNETNLKDWHLVFELEQKPEQGSSPLEVTIAAPMWTLTKG